MTDQEEKEKQQQTKDYQEKINQQNLNLKEIAQKGDVQILYDLQDQQKNLIQQEVEKEPLFSDKIPIFTLTMDFQNNEKFLFKVLDLIQNKQKEFFRKTRKDGSCFYRCFLFRLFEQLIINSNNFEQFKIFQKIQQGRELMIKSGYQEIVFEDFEDVYKKMMNDIQQKNVTLDQLVIQLSDKMYFDYFVLYIRFIISAYIRVNSPLFEMYFGSELELNEFCRRDVEIIDSEVDQIQIMALYQFFEIPLRIFYLDNSDGKQITCFSLPDITPNNNEKINQTNNQYPIQFIYKPGHYDMLY